MEFETLQTSCSLCTVATLNIFSINLYLDKIYISYIEIIVLDFLTKQWNWINTNINLYDVY